MLVNPNIGFIKKLKDDTGVSFSECMQCGSCSVVCKLSPEESPFPRKEMIWSAWGLEEKLLGDPDIWLCHQCGDCSDTCPRGVKPADVIAALRKQSYSKYSGPGLLTKLLSKAALLPIAILIPAIIILSIIFLSGTSSIPEGDVDYSKFFPHFQLNLSFSMLLLLVIIGLIPGLRNFIEQMKTNMPGEKKHSWFKSFLSVSGDIIFHRYFNKCGNNKSRALAHLLVFYGFIILLFVTLVAIVNVIFFDYPMAFWHPAKLAGNLASLMLVTGTIMMGVKRIKEKKRIGSNYFDWSFLVLLFLLTLTGSLTQVARFQNWETAYHIYFIHLVLVWMVIIYLPYTKFGHLIYRVVAMVYARSIGRI